LKTASISDDLETLKGVNKKSFYQPYQLLLPFALTLAILPFFFWTQSIDPQIFKLNILLTDRSYLRILAVVLFIQWMAYLFLYKQFLKILTTIQIAISLTAVAIIILEGKWILEPDQSNRAQYTIMRVLLNGDVRELNLFSLEGITFVTAQLLFLVNLSIAVLRRSNERQTT
jgi:hypothetical protein